MTVADWVTLIVAICGVLHGPLIPSLLNRTRKRKVKP